MTMCYMLHVSDLCEEEEPLFINFLFFPVFSLRSLLYEIDIFDTD